MLGVVEGADNASDQRAGEIHLCSDDSEDSELKDPRSRLGVAIKANNKSQERQGTGVSDPMIHFSAGMLLRL